MKIRGQSALEYLVTYGWAILVIVIILAVLWSTGIFSPQRFAGGKSCGGFASFTCIDYNNTAVGGTQTVILLLGNSAGRTLALPTSGNPSCGTGSLGPAANATCTWSGVAGSAGDSVSVTIAFTDTRSGLSHSETGTVRLQ